MRLPGVLPGRRDNSEFEKLLEWKLGCRQDENAAEQAARLLRGEFRFLDTSRELPDPVDWQLQQYPDAAHLWRFHLHYHEFLLDLVAEGTKHDDAEHFDRAWNLVDQWIEGNRLDDPRVAADAWHPYCISRRLPAWMLLWTASPPVEELAQRVLGSMFCQARFLSRHLEWDVRGNHLLENARAMVLVGSFLDGPNADRWLRRGAKVFRKELEQQILDHGEHFERSPMYHAEMLEAVLDVRDVTVGLMPELARSCDLAASRMARFLEDIVHPDGRIPLLGDSCFGHSAEVDQLADRVDERGSDENARGIPKEQPLGRVTGDYWTFGDRDHFLIFDAGPVGPDHLPAHAHADLLGFEASFAGQRLFVDGGVFNYEDDAMRRYCRSSAAHNVLTVDDVDQCDLWSRFRMGYRGWPGKLASGQTDGFSWARATHNAYRRLGVPKVGRWVACRPDGPWLCVDWAEGTGRHTLTQHLHLHPDVTAQITADDQLRLTAAGVSLQLRFLTPGQITLTDAWYCPEFGRRLESSVVRWTSETALPVVCGWQLTWDGCQGQATLDSLREDSDLMNEVVLDWTGENASHRLCPLGRDPLD